MKEIYKKPTANIILNGKNQNAFPLRLETRQECLHSLLPFNIILEVLASAIRQEKEIKVNQIRKKVQFSFTDDIAIYVKNLTEFREKLREPMSLARFQFIRSIYKNKLCSYILAIENKKFKFEKIHL